jgi:hypothetical protein
MTEPFRPSGKGNESSGRIIARVIWMSFKIFIIPIFCIAALIVGLVVGYVILGDKPLSEVFDTSTWKHLYDLVFAEGG